MPPSHCGDSLVVTPADSGEANMALDEAVLGAVLEGAGPVLRLYSWDGPWISLGYAQSAERALDGLALKSAGVGLVRRPTGGKALLHHRDLTYSVAVGPDHPLAQLSVADSYRELCGPLVVALRTIGLMATLARTAPDELECAPRPEGDLEECRADLPCAAQVHLETVLVRGKKLVGSAQVRRHGAVLQHGSIPMVRPDDTLVRCLARPGRADDAFVAWYRGRTTTLEDEGLGGCREALEVALVRAFHAVLAADP